ncbi:T9SS type A sorting domain-containing protein [Dyadobacter subterraneus]|uniref:T9SS type A sorting domain-containing protein n=1 Tax=Dyadobacter subterraneus TaxID=2773304 RepID=A0ABR9WE28_9BACT|nr:T9SS type A sorting domain-containing protein [Dyadobacter subterraneus]MBE9463753.1 T9SS type A sorting domain-containing protein [Dyadobacter subterraneus]
MNWSAVTKIHFSQFEIERSGDEQTWVNLGSILASNQHSTNAQYSFLDKNPLNGDNFYRLKMIDLDGNYSYSDTRQVSFDFLIYTIYPNPASDKFYLSGGLLENAKSVVIKNQSGITLFESSGVLEDGISTNKFSDGLYIIRVRMADDSVRTLKMVVSK